MTFAFRIVLNYRRDDSPGHAGRLYEALALRFGAEHVFTGIDNLEPGVDFLQVIEVAIDSCDAFLALIGPRWLDTSDAQGRRRLEYPDDFVRLEIEAALGRNVRVIPVLLQDAKMPRSEELPRSLAPLTQLDAHDLSDGSWPSDVGRLIQTLEGQAGARSLHRHRP